ncbi:MAG TPA: winged helix-turn-helix transcriptional regulator [Chloroflexi bacterium]|nr:winged helix-turn-helix transcriptional regulator [Chloroflexota bacterium]
MNDDFVCLTTEKQIRIFMFPLRQKILKLMYQTGKPMTAKQISDQLAISPSSAKHHLLK